MSFTSEEVGIALVGVNSDYRGYGTESERVSNHKGSLSHAVSGGSLGGASHGRLIDVGVKYWH